MSRVGVQTFCCLTCTRLLDFYPSWWVYPHLENFIPNTKNARNMITIVNANILIGQKISLWIFIPQNYTSPKIFTFWVILIFFYKI